MEAMPRPRPPHLHRETTRHGVCVWYVRRGRGPRIRLRAEYGSEAFWSEYRAAIEGAPLPSPTPKAHTLAWAIERYRQGSAWNGLSAATRRQRENIFKVVVRSSGAVPFAAITPEAIRDGRERRKTTPHAANNFLKAMRGLFAWAVEAGLISDNPTKGVKLLSGPNDERGFHAWTQEELQQFEAAWPVGTRERLAYDLLLYTGLRRGDAVRLGKQHVRDGIITIRTEKHRKGKDGVQVSIPILPPLAASLTAAKTGDLAFLVTESGQPWAKESFGNWFSSACRKAGCPGSAHGLRKAAATRMADHGATERQLMAVFGWTTNAMALHYTRGADRARLARDSAKLMLERPHLGSGAGTNSDKVTKSGA